MKDLTFCNLLLSREKKKLKKSTLKELKRSDSKRLRIRKDLLPRFKERESRSLERCIKQERTSKLKEAREISLRNTPTLDHLYMLQSLEMVFLLIKKLTSMKFNQKLSHLTKVLRSLVDPFLQVSSKPKSVSRNSSLTSRIISQDLKFLILLNLKKLKPPLTLKSSNKDSKTKNKVVKKIQWTRLR
jgi:hypothetical protein